MLFNNIFNLALATALAAMMAGPSVAVLSGSGTATYRSYEEMDPVAVKNNPPFCGMPYAELLLGRIAAVQLIDGASECGKCIKVSSQEDPSKSVYVLAVDKGDSGLDLSKTAFSQLFNVDSGIGAASWEPADDANCSGIWSKIGSGTSNGPGLQEVPVTPVAQAVPSVPPVPEVWARAGQPVWTPTPVYPYHAITPDAAQEKDGDAAVTTPTVARIAVRGSYFYNYFGH